MQDDLIGSCREYIRRTLPETNISEHDEILNDALEMVTENPFLSLTQMVKTLCGIWTLDMVMDGRKITPHQRKVIFEDRHAEFQHENGYHS